LEVVLVSNSSNSKDECSNCEDKFEIDTDQSLSQSLLTSPDQSCVNFHGEAAANEFPSESNNEDLADE